MGKTEKEKAKDKSKSSDKNKFRDKVPKKYQENFFKGGFVYGSYSGSYEDTTGTIINDEFEAEVLLGKSLKISSGRFKLKIFFLSNKKFFTIR